MFTARQMRTSTVTAVLILVFALGLTVTPSISATTKPQGFLSTKETWIVDASGRVVILRGMNYPGYERASSDPKPHSELAYTRFARLGFNVVRLPISWANLEPVPGMFYKPFLTQYVDRDVRWAKKYGLFIILDMHQFNWASRFGGSGAPGWAVDKYPATGTGMRQAVSDFWNSSSLQEHFINLWRVIAQKYAKEPTIAGYDILNEPWIYSSLNQNLNASIIDAFYLKVIAAIRSIDPNHIIFIEPANMHTSALPLNANLVWSPHFYSLSFATKYYHDNYTILKADLEAKYKRFVLEGGTPMWIGEFGAFMKDNDSNQRWLQDALKILDEYKVGWAWWPSSDRSLICPLQPSC